MKLLDSSRLISMAGMLIIEHMALEPRVLKHI
nr:MAG TPA: hypothetical protein [Caudoviricetes sp.]